MSGDFRGSVTRREDIMCEIPGTRMTRGSRESVWVWKKKFGPVGEKGTGKELVIYRAGNCVRGELDYVQFTREVKQKALWPRISI